MYKVSLALGIGLVLFLIPIQVDARKNYEDIGISLDRTCLALLKAQMKTDCPTYEDILLLFPDTSNKRISGDFVYKDGFLQRENPPYRNHYAAYEYEKPIVWVDPPSDVIAKAKHIIITTKLPYYKVSESNKKINNTLTFGQDRYVDSCKTAIITAEKWLVLLGDTIQYLQSGCKTTNFDSIVKIWQKPMEHDPKSSTWYKYQQWLKNAKLESKNKFLIDPDKPIYSPEARK